MMFSTFGYATDATERGGAMTDADIIAEWNQTGCRGCCKLFSLRPAQVRGHINRLRRAGHAVKKWPRIGRPRLTDRHLMLAGLEESNTMAAISRATGFTYRQVRYSVDTILLGRRS